MKIKVKTTLDQEFFIKLPPSFQQLVANEKQKAFYLFSVCPETIDNFDFEDRAQFVNEYKNYLLKTTTIPFITIIMNVTFCRWLRVKNPIFQLTHLSNPIGFTNKYILIPFLAYYALKNAIFKPLFDRQVDPICNKYNFNQKVYEDLYNKIIAEKFIMLDTVSIAVR